jgi:hypothetical protein
MAIGDDFTKDHDIIPVQHGNGWYYESERPIVYN